jgi:RimK family alpha-L-glutamate ligase
MKPNNIGVDRHGLSEERSNKKAVLTFGRFNPPTSGHELLISKVVGEAKKRRADNFVFASHSQDKRKNPLDSKTKNKYMKAFFKNANVMYNPAIRTIFEAIGYLSDEGYKDVTVVVGGDRTDEFERTVRPYVNHPDPDKSFDLESFDVVSAGQRDPDAKDVSGMSASKMRAAAAEGNFRDFKLGVPSTSNDTLSRKLFDAVRKGMGVRGGDIVEESQMPVTKTRVVVFTNDGDEGTAKRIVEECEKKGNQVFVAEAPAARVVKEDNGNFTIRNKDNTEFTANRFDTVIIVRVVGKQNRTLDNISQLQSAGFFVINSIEAIENCHDKFRTSIMLDEAGIATPKTSIITDPDLALAAHEEVGGKFPVVLKTVSGAGGKGVFIIDSDISLKSTVSAFFESNADEELLIQQFLPLNGDIRVLVLNGRVLGAMNREKVKNDFRSNASLGANVNEADISDEIKEMAINAAKAMGCYYCGVDIAIQKRSRKPFVLEVNTSPGSKNVEEALRKNIIGEFVKEILDKENWQYPPTTVGRREIVDVDGLGKLVAKFDTGNTAHNVVHADRYDISNSTVTWTHGGKTFTNDVKRILNIEQGAIGTIREKRPVIELDMEFMGIKYPKTLFTLDDRSTKSTPVLMGVPFMKQFHIVVDSSKTYIKTERLDEYTSADLEGTTALTKKRKRMTPGQVNEIADTYFKGDLT